MSELTTWEVDYWSHWSHGVTGAMELWESSGTTGVNTVMGQGIVQHL